MKKEMEVKNFKTTVEAHFAAGMVYGSPGTDGTFLSNYWSWVKNNHALLSMFLASRYHYLSRIDRRMIFFHVICISLLITTYASKSNTTVRFVQLQGCASRVNTSDPMCSPDLKDWQSDVRLCCVGNCRGPANINRGPYENDKALEEHRVAGTLFVKEEFCAEYDGLWQDASYFDECQKQVDDWDKKSFEWSLRIGLTMTVIELVLFHLGSCVCCIGRKNEEIWQYFADKILFLIFIPSLISIGFSIFHMTKIVNQWEVLGEFVLGKFLSWCYFFALNGNPLIIYCFFNRHKKIFQKLYGDSALTIPNDDFETKSGIAMGEMK